MEYTKLQQIKDNEVYQQVPKDSFGGVMYNVANQSKYEAAPVLQLWDSMSPAEHEAAGGIMKGALNFLQGS